MLVLMKQLSTADIGIDEVYSYLLLILALMEWLSTVNIGIDGVVCTADIGIDEVDIYC